MFRKYYILELSENRVRRNYRGGAQLDVISGLAVPEDGNKPEDWIASTTQAKNPGLPEISGEGLARVTDGTGQNVFLKEMFAAHPEHYLGENHFKSLGTDLGFLVKLLDSSMRLHVQAHPTASFAQEHLNSRWGKLETYVILGNRAGCAPYIRLGFQRPPTPDEWKRIVFEQDIEAMDACFDKIPVHKGEVWLVPGGLPHAIGEGLLVMEVMEPTDLVVRCEFEREGIVVPPQARFMGRNPDFAMEIFDYTPMPIERLHAECRIKPSLVYNQKDILQELLIGGAQTDCFSEYRVIVSGDSSLPLNGKVGICVVSKGAGTIKANNESIKVEEGSKFLIAAATKDIKILPSSGQMEILLCHPGHQ